MSATSASANSRARRPDDLPRMAASIAPSVRNSSWSSCPSRISGSRWEALSRRTTSTAFQALRIAGNWPGRVFRSICATGFSIGTRAPFGLTFAVESQLNRIDETSGGGRPEFRHGIHARVRPRIDSEFCGRGSQPDLSAGMDALRRQPAPRNRNPPSAPRSGVMAQVRPGILLGGEARYLRRYDGIGLEEFAGQALVRRSDRVFPALGALAADRSLERSGLGTSGRIERSARSR